MKNKILISFFIFLALISCTKKVVNLEPKYTFVEIDNLLHETSPGNNLGPEAIQYNDYGPGANRVESKNLVYKHLVFYAISFGSIEEARSEALRLNQYYARNWLLDRVEGEPLLEDYLIERLNAINPTRRIQRVPKKDPNAHGEGHGEAHGADHGAAAHH